MPEGERVGRGCLEQRRCQQLRWHRPGVTNRAALSYHLPVGMGFGVMVGATLTTEKEVAFSFLMSGMPEN